MIEFVLVDADATGLESDGIVGVAGDSGRLIDVAAAGAVVVVVDGKVAQWEDTLQLLELVRGQQERQL